MSSSPMVDGPGNWTSESVGSNQTAWKWKIRDTARKRLRNALEALAPASDSDAYAMSHRIDLSCIRNELTEAYDSAENGLGFALLAGLPLDGLTRTVQDALTLAVSDAIGHVVAQNFEGQQIVDVRDEGIPYTHQSRGYRGNAPLPFHTDGANLFTLTCLSQAPRGGETIVASATAVHNELAAHYPDALARLYHGYFHHRRGQHEPDENPLSPRRIPVFALHDGLLHCCYNRNPIEWACKEGVELDEGDVAALDALDALLANPRFHLRLKLQPGECLVVNNFLILHSRTAYEDTEGCRRHMLRVWMNDPNSARQGLSLLQLYVPPSLQ